MIRFIAILGLVVSTQVLAAAVNSGTTKVKEVYSYAQVGDAGDVVFTVESTSSMASSGCIGFWLDSRDPGFKNNMTFLLSAYHADTPVLIYGKDDELFPASSGNYCRMTIIRFRPK